MTAPKVMNILQEKGEIDDELDFALMNYLMKNRGPGFTACQPQLVELEGGKKAIKMGIDKTYIDKNNKLMGLGIIGTVIIDYDNLKVLFCTPLEDLVENVEKLKNAGIDPQPRPKGKY